MPKTIQRKRTPDANEKVEIARKTRERERENETDLESVEAEPTSERLQRAMADPLSARPAEILSLQRKAGNRAVQRLIQRRLVVGAAHDPYEQEADRMAEQVVAAPDRGPADSGGGPALQRDPSEEGEPVQRSPLASQITRVAGAQPGAGSVELQGVPEVQTAGIEDSFDASADVERGILQTRGAGEPLPTPVRSDMESRFGADFGGVRVHSDGESAALNKSLHSQAFTHGSDIYFGDSKFAPETSHGKHLLAHELTHVVQQGSAHLKREDANAPAAAAEGEAPGQVSRKLDNVVQRGPKWDKFKTGAKNLGKNVGKFMIKHKDTEIEPTSGGKKAAKVAVGVTEGAINAFVGAINPRWWIKAVQDIKEIEPKHYGSGKAGEHLARLAKSSQVFQKIATIVGWAALISGIIGAAGAGFGAGAAGLAVSAILGLISMCLSGVVFIIQNVLFWYNVANYKTASTEQKKKMWQDLASMIGSALAVVGGGLGVNFAQMGNIHSQVGQAVIDTGTSGVSGQVGQQFAGAGIGQTLGTTSDTVSEVVDIATKPDPFAGPLIQREGETGESESEEKSQLTMIKSSVLSSIPLILGEASNSQSKASEDKAGLTKSLEAVGKSIEVMDTPLDKVPGTDKVKKYAKDTGMPVAQGAMDAPEKMKEAEQLLDQGAKDKSKPGDISDSKEGELDKLEPDLERAETELEVKAEPEEKKKPGIGQRIKGWLMSRFMNLKKRIARIYAKIKAKIMEFSIQVLGLKEPFAEIQGDLEQKQAQTPSGISSAEGITAESMKAAEMADKLGSQVGKMK